MHSKNYEFIIIHLNFSFKKCVHLIYLINIFEIIIYNQIRTYKIRIIINKIFKNKDFNLLYYKDLNLDINNLLLLY